MTLRTQLGPHGITAAGAHLAVAPRSSRCASLSRTPDRIHRSTAPQIVPIVWARVDRSYRSPFAVVALVTNCTQKGRKKNTQGDFSAGESNPARSRSSYVMKGDYTNRYTSEDLVFIFANRLSFIYSLVADVMFSTSPRASRALYLCPRCPDPTDSPFSCVYQESSCIAHICSPTTPRLVPLVRINAVHGLAAPADPLNVGKQQIGAGVKVSAKVRADVRGDDGAGVDQERVLVGQRLGVCHVEAYG